MTENQGEPRSDAVSEREIQAWRERVEELRLFCSRTRALREPGSEVIAAETRLSAVLDYGCTLMRRAAPPAAAPEVSALRRLRGDIEEYRRADVLLTPEQIIAKIDRLLAADPNARTTP